MDNARLFARFDDICVQHNGGYPWVTVFKEEKKSSEAFQPIVENTVLVFCKLHESTYEDWTYLGHFLLQKTMQAYELSARIAHEIANIPEEAEFVVRLENGKCGKDISNEAKTLEDV